MKTNPLYKKHKQIQNIKKIINIQNFRIEKLNCYSEKIRIFELSDPEILFRFDHRPIRCRFGQLCSFLSHSLPLRPCLCHTACFSSFVSHVWFLFLSPVGPFYPFSLGPHMSPLCGFFFFNFSKVPIYTKLIPKKRLIFFIW